MPDQSRRVTTNCSVLSFGPSKHASLKAAATELRRETFVSEQEQGHSGAERTADREERALAALLKELEACESSIRTLWTATERIAALGGTVIVAS